MDESLRMGSQVPPQEEDQVWGEGGAQVLLSEYFKKLVFKIQTIPIARQENLSLPKFDTQG